MDNYKYQEIAVQIRAAIDAGDYLVGSKLPAHRVLAKKMGTTAVTVAKAYQLLAKQRVVESFVGKGSYVLSQRLDNVIHAQQAGNALNFSILQPQITATLRVINQQLSTSLNSFDDATLFGYSEKSGLLAHRLGGAKWCEHYGLKVPNPEQILLTNGAQNALASLIQLFSKEGDAIAVEALTYPGILAICTHLRRRIIPIAMDEQGMLADDLHLQCSKEQPVMAIVLPSQQNPTGATMQSARRKEIAKVVATHDIWLLEDDIYAFLNEKNLSPISNYVPDKAFYISSLSKSISPGFRCGYIKAPTDQYLKLADFIRATLWLASPFMFDVATKLIESKQAFEIAAMQCAIARERQLLVSKYLPQAKIERQSASYSCWLHLPAGVSTKQFTSAAAELDISISEAAYFNSAAPVNAVRLSVMSVAQESLFIDGLKSINQLLSTLKNH
jgi:DNA-binding transcriptional MocR family regulator